MILHTKLAFAAVAVLAGTSALCPPCGAGVRSAGAQHLGVARQVADTATVRLHLSGMTCGSCATTARLALRRVPGVYGAEVSYEAAAALVRYDPAQTSPERLIERLADLTGYGGRVIADAPEPARRGRS
ncbi:MAG: heavy-metal-associated domain-containing protein [Gemmatimonadales bacterium]